MAGLHRTDAPSPWNGEGLARRPVHAGGPATAPEQTLVLTATVIGSYSPSVPILARDLTRPRLRSCAGSVRWSGSRRRKPMRQDRQSTGLALPERLDREMHPDFGFFASAPPALEHGRNAPGVGLSS